MATTHRRNCLIRAGTLIWISALSFGCSTNDDETQGDSVEIALIFDSLEPLRLEGAVADTLAAVEEINSAGGLDIDGSTRPLALVPAAHEGEAASGVALLEELAASGITAFIGPQRSSVLLGSEENRFQDGIAAAAVDAHVLVVSDGATSPAITDLEDNDLVWRVAPSDALQGAIAAEEVAQQGMTTAAILHRGDPYGTGLASAFEDTFLARGGTITARVEYDTTGSDITDLETHDYDAELAELFADQPEIIYLVTFFEFFRISNRIVVGGHLDAYDNSPPAFFATEALFDEDVPGNANAQVLELLSGTAPHPDTESESYQKAIAALSSAGLGPDVDPFDLARYDAVYLLACAMQSAGTAQADLVKAHLRPISRDDGDDVRVGPGDWDLVRESTRADHDIDYEGASGPINMTEAGDPGAGSFEIWTMVRDGAGGFEFETLKLVEFDSE